MASCYNCGKNGSNYRRTVNTGYSTGTNYGKRITFSNRSYFGPRTLCETCAYQNDRSNIINGIIWRYIIVFVLIAIITHYKFKLW